MESIIHSFILLVLAFRKKRVYLLWLGLLVGLVGLLELEVYAQEIDPYKVRFRVKEGFEKSVPLFQKDSRVVSKVSIPSLWQDIIQAYRVTALQKASRLPSPLLQRYFEITVADSNFRDPLFQHLRRISFIEHVEYYEWHQIFTLPNDIRVSQWYLSKVRAVEAWQISLGSPKVLLAMVDDAVYLEHEDLKESIYINPREIPNNGVDDDNNGYIDDVNGWDVADNDNDPNPPANANANFFSHGTHCAGIAAARTNNGLGIASLGGNVTILPVKASISSGNGRTIQAAYQGVEYAALMGAKVISCSWGSSRYSQFAQDLVSYVASQGITILAAAGNSSTNAPHYPAAYEDVIAVAASNSQDKLASFSNYGKWVDVVAPGERIISSVAGNPSNYAYYDGTSMATPLVAGLCAQMYSVNPYLTNRQLLECLKATAVSIDHLHPDKAGELGAGRIDAAAALACALPKQNEVALYPISIPWACSLSDSLYFEVQNQGRQTYNSLSFEYEISGIPGEQNFSWQGFLAGGQALRLGIPTNKIPQGISTLTIRLNPTPPGDNTPNNNQLTFAFYKPTIGDSVTCGQFIKGTTLNGLALNSSYACANRSFKGPEVWHPFILQQPSLLDIRFRYAREVAKGQVIIVRDCNPQNCIATFDVDTMVYLDQKGEYYLIVNSDSLALDYELGFNCVPWNCGLEQEPISCGAVVSGNLAQGSNLLEYYGNCRFEQLAAKEKIYVWEVSDTTRLQARLSNVTQNTYIMLLSACDAPVCVAAGFANSNNNTPMNARLAPGKYYIVVDAVAPTQYTLTLECYDCASAPPIRCGSKVNGTNVGRTNRVNNYCASGLNLNGPEVVHPLILEAPGFITVKLITEQPNLEIAVLSNCNYSRCLGSGRQEVSFLAPAAGTYQVVVDSRNWAVGNYTLTVECEASSCHQEEKLTCGSEIRGLITDAGFSRWALYDCAAGRDLLGTEVIYPIEIAESGPRLVQLNLNSSDPTLDMLILNECNPFRCAAIVDSDYSAWVTGPRTLYVALERNRPGNITNNTISYILKVNCFTFNCTEQSTLLKCNVPFRGNTSQGQNRFTSYNCRGGSFIGPERIHRIQLSEASNLFIRLRSLTPGRRAFGFLIGGCNPQNCFLFIRDSINVRAGMGTYFLVVEGEGIQGVEYEVEYMCSSPNCANAESITCGVPIRGSTQGLRSQLGYYACSYSAPLAGGEKVYSFNPPQSGLYRFELVSHNSSENPHVLILQTDCNGFYCQALWEAAPRLQEFHYLEAGRSYFLVIDSYLPGTSFELRVHCPCTPITIEGLAPAYCPAQPVSIRANSSGGMPLWYDAPAGNNLLRRGPFFTLPQLTKSQVVYVETNSSCVPRRQAVWLNLSQPIIQLQANKAAVCVFDTLVLQASGAKEYQWKTYEQANLINQGQDALVIPKSEGKITVIGADENGCQNTSSWPVRIQAGPPATIYLKGDTLFTQTFSRYQWYYEEKPIANATKQYYVPQKTGNYSVYVESQDHECGTLSNPFKVSVITGQLFLAETNGYCIYPNPTKDILYIEISDLQEEFEYLRLHNTLGQNFHVSFTLEEGQTKRYKLELKDLPAGIYMLNLGSKKHKSIQVAKIIKH
ncbi:MAG: S8 family serine peptidase [Bacteroidia bacterium]|nr:S8 family serine peptidase [Bacteroidia bacterium]MDW8158369.1 S8 family serine peptidase [Bacteroidia bacterium]